jgi:hypothetical protein
VTRWIKSLPNAMSGARSQTRIRLRSEHPHSIDFSMRFALSSSRMLQRPFKRLRSFRKALLLPHCRRPRRTLISYCTSDSPKGPPPLGLTETAYLESRETLSCAFDRLPESNVRLLMSNLLKSVQITR